MVHGLVRIGSASPSRVIVTAQPSSCSFLATRAVQPSEAQVRASSSTSGASSAGVAGVFDIVVLLLRAGQRAANA
jgi:hypothetical protein